jgi:dienelactone hydrolase
MPTYSADFAAILEREPAVETTGSEVDYLVGDVACRGYLARPTTPGPHPAVLVIHDWLGVSDYTRMRADMLARLGYIAFAGDVYGADVRPSEQEAAGVAGGYYGNPQLWRERLLGAFDRMTSEDDVDRSRTAAIGYCFGGSAVLQLARTGVDIGAVVSFHGALHAGPAGEAEQIRARMLLLHGANDPVAPDEDVAALVNELRGVPTLDWELTVYSGAMHAFTMPHVNAPEHGAQFNAIAERRSWDAMKSLLAEVLA